MKANELRIGNWIKDQGMQLQVGMINSALFDGAEPIPITEEWLVKFGFKYLDEDNEFIAYPVLIEALKLNADSSNLFNTCTLRIHKNLTIGVQYVHQLQNLYFALTGTELIMS